jgi:drug/metabolite transporter (DMT)-like permease
MIQLSRCHIALIENLASRVATSVTPSSAPARPGMSERRTGAYHPRMSRTPSNPRAYLELAAAMALVGSAVVAGKLVVADFPVFLASELRYLIGATVLVPLVLLREGGLPRPGRRDGLALVLQALTGVFLFNVLLLYGLHYTTATASGIITSATPAVVLLISAIGLRERAGPRAGAGVALAVLGVLAINLLGGGGGSDDTASNPLLGNLLVVGAVIGEALFTIFGKLVSGRLTPLAISAANVVLGMLFFLPFAVYDATGFDFAGPSLADWLPIVYFGLAVTVGAFLLWFHGVASVPASTAAVFTGILPISAVVLSALVLGEPFGWSGLAGMGCVLAGIALIARGSVAREADPATAAASAG